MFLPLQGFAAQGIGRLTLFFLLPLPPPTTTPAARLLPSIAALDGGGGGGGEAVAISLVRVEWASGEGKPGKAARAARNKFRLLAIDVSKRSDDAKRYRISRVCSSFSSRVCSSFSLYVSVI